jgi:hypothetical protein
MSVLSQHDDVHIANLLKNGHFIHEITNVVEEGIQVLSPIQQMVDQRIRELLPDIVLKIGFEDDYNMLRVTAFSQEQAIAKNSLTLLGLRALDKERTLKI